MIDHKRKNQNFREPTYQPWADSHAPKNFERTDKTGRYIPIEERDKPDWSTRFSILIIVGCCIVWLTFLIPLIFWGVAE